MKIVDMGIVVIVSVDSAALATNVGIVDVILKLYMLGSCTGGEELSMLWSKK